MSKKKYLVTVKRIDEYEIEVDETVWDEEALKNWSNAFYEVESVEELVKEQSIHYMRHEDFQVDGLRMVTKVCFDQEHDVEVNEI